MSSDLQEWKEKNVCERRPEVHTGDSCLHIQHLLVVGEPSAEEPREF